MLIFIFIQFNSHAFAARTMDDLQSINASNGISRETRLQAGSIIALNNSITLRGKFIPIGSELIVDNLGNLSLVNSIKNKQENEDLLDTGANINELYPSEFTVLNQNELTGEIEPYNLADDFNVAGPTVGRGKRSGVTNCYHVVKYLVRERITLYGVAAYMAAPQLKEAGWHRYVDYDSAPEGSVCVFNKGGIPTTSGGQIYGHIGVKGASGIANPTSGFHLKRPFLGCWNEV